MPQGEPSHNSSSRQDFVAKVRYNNDLPPPPCPPKELKYSAVKDPMSVDSSTFLTSLFRHENYGNLVTLNNDLGMTMNLLDVPDCLEKNSLETLGQLTPEYGDGLSLHPSDQLILADPSRSTTVKGETVSFLRRTQYIAANQTQLPSRYSAGAITSISATKNALQKKLKLRKEEELDPKNQFRAVEAMFSTGIDDQDISKLHHPVKKHLKAKRVWNFLPDTSMLDQKFYDVKFLSSASIRKGKNKRKDDIRSENDPRLLTSLLREIKLNQETTLVSFYTTNEDSASQLKKQFEDETENAPITEEQASNPVDNTPYIYSKIRDYDGKVHSFKDNEALRHLAISFDNKTGTAMYVPLDGKLELRKCRIDPYLQPKVKELSYDQIYLSVREPTRGEIEDRDMMRSNYDPMEFGADEDEDKETDKKEEAEKKDESDKKEEDKKQEADENSETDKTETVKAEADKKDD